MKILEKKDFTLGDLLNFTTDAKSEVKIYESCFTKDYTTNQINAVALFENIYDLYNEKTEIISISDFQNKHSAIDIEFLREFGKKNTDALNLPINRDIEDGYVYSNFDVAILTDNKLVLL